jgi:hypothetical protein
MSRIPPQRDRGISHRAYHRKLVAFENKEKDTWTPPKRSARQRKRTAWHARVARWRRVGTETLYGLDILAVQTHRKGPGWRLTKVGEDGSLFYYGLRKLKALSNAFLCTPSARWELVGPEGFVGVRTQHVTKMGALRLCADLDESKFDKEENDE